MSFDFFPPCSLPCDIVGDISYEELRAVAYDDAKRGTNLQAIVSFLPSLLLLIMHSVGIIVLKGLK